MSSPLCVYGFPCVHRFEDDEGDGCCLHPFTHLNPPKCESDLERTSVNSLTCDMLASECPLGVPVMRHIIKMADILCDRCNGTGGYYRLLCRDDVCPECKGTGLMPEELRREEQEEADAAYKIMDGGKEASDEGGDL